VEAEQHVRLGLTDFQARDAYQDREQTLDLAERPGEGPTERTVRPHSAPPTRTLVREDTQPASLVEVQAEEVGPSLRWATAKVERVRRGDSGPAKGGQFNDEPPF
jgi:hypothetical protein